MSTVRMLEDMEATRLKIEKTEVESDNQTTWRCIFRRVPEMQFA